MYRQHHPNDPGQHHQASRPDPDNLYTGRTTYRHNPTFVERVRQSLLAVVAGVALLAAAVVLLFWNEGRAVHTSQTLAEGLASVRYPDASHVAMEENNNKLVYISAPLHTLQVLHDAEYGVSVSAVKLKRNVEMYQWIEHETKRETNEGGETRTDTSYDYTREWHSSLVPSHGFYLSLNHKNPSEMGVSSQTYVAPDVQVGAFHLSKALISSITTFHPFIPHEVPFPLHAKLHDGKFFHGVNPLSPEVGDIRVSFQYAGLSGNQHSSLGPAETVSVIAKQEGDMLMGYQTETGGKLELLYMGMLSAQQIFGKEQAVNTFTTWGIRFVGWLLMFVAFGCLTKIIITLVDWFPIVRELVTLGVMTLNATLSISLSLTVIALGWLRYRPFLGGSILALALLPFIINTYRARARPRTWQRTDRPFVD